MAIAQTPIKSSLTLGGQECAYLTLEKGTEAHKSGVMCPWSQSVNGRVKI